MVQVSEFPQRSDAKREEIMRKIASFKGRTCIVGRGWAENPNRHFKGEVSWYRFRDQDNHNPGVSYYIDSCSGIGADLVFDFGEPLPPEVIPDGRFDRVVLEFLPGVLFELGKSTLSNSNRITAQGGTVEVHSSVQVLSEVSARMENLGFTCKQGKHHRYEPVSGATYRENNGPQHTKDWYDVKTSVNILFCVKK